MYDCLLALCWARVMEAFKYLGQSGCFGVKRHLAVSNGADSVLIIQHSAVLKYIFYKPKLKQFTALLLHVSQKQTYSRCQARGGIARGFLIG